MTARTTWMAAALLVIGGTLGAACDSGGGSDGGSDAATDTAPDTAGGDTAGGDTAAPDTSTADTGAPDTSGEDTAADTGPAPDTTPADTTPDTGPPAKLLCPDVAQCLLETCAAEADPATCFASSTTVCGEPDSQAEADAALAWTQCLLDNNCTLTESDDFYECNRVHCLDAIRGCYTAPAGTEECTKLRGCSSGCGSFLQPSSYRLFDDDDAACVRACLADGPAAEIDEYWRLTLCELETCWDSDTFEDCLALVINNPVCTDFYDQCLGDTGSAPGAGPGGGE